MRVTHLDQEALQLLQARVEVLGSRAAVAAELGYSRSALSQAMDRRYPGDVRHLRAKVIETYAQRVACPHVRADLPPAVCRENRERPLNAAMASRDTVKLWQACQICQHNPRAHAAKDGAA